MGSGSSPAMGHYGNTRVSKLMENSLYYVLIIVVGYGLELINQILVTAMYIISYSIDTSQGG